MQTFWLIFSSVVLPLVWGWAANWLLARLWPEKQPLVAARQENIRRQDPLSDYQI
jgi:hypothetical protein